MMPGMRRAVKKLIFLGLLASGSCTVYSGDSNRKKKFKKPTANESAPTTKNGFANSVSVEKDWYICVPSKSPALALVAQNPIKIPLLVLGNHLLKITRFMAHPGDYMNPLIIFRIL